MAAPDFYWLPTAGGSFAGAPYRLRRAAPASAGTVKGEGGMERMDRRLEIVDATGAPPVWAALRNEAQHVANTEPSLASLVNAVILRHGHLASALSYQLARKLGDQELRAMSLREIAEEAYATDPSIVAAAEAD